MLAKRLKGFADESLPIEPLVNFWKNLRKNPLESTKEDLYEFLEKNHHPITPNGQFIAYKKVEEDGNGKLVDGYTGNYDHSPGKMVEMPRKNVDANRDVTCSTGLHVASWVPAQNYLSGGILIEVIVNPVDVVAVPVDYNRQKMRTCRYMVIDVVKTETERKEELVEAKGDSTLSSVVKKDPDCNNISLIDKDKGKYKPAKNIIGLVTAHLNIDISGMSLKNKVGIVKKAIKLFTEAGYKVKTLPKK